MTATTTTIKQQAEALTAAMGYDLPHTFEADLTAFTTALSTWEPPTAVIEGRITGASLMTLREDPTMAALDELRNDVQALIADLDVIPKLIKGRHRWVLPERHEGSAGDPALNDCCRRFPGAEGRREGGQVSLEGMR